MSFQLIHRGGHLALYLAVFASSVAKLLFFFFFESRVNRLNPPPPPPPYHYHCLQQKHYWSLQGSFDPALLIQLYSNTAGGAAAFQRGICLWVCYWANLGMSQGSVLALGKTVQGWRGVEMLHTHRLNNSFTPTPFQTLQNSGTGWQCGLMLIHGCRCFHVRKRCCCLSGVVQQEMVCHWLKSFACYLFWLVDLQLIYMHNMAVQKQMVTVCDTCIC